MTRCRTDEWPRLAGSRQPGGHPFVVDVVDERYGTVSGVFGPQVHLDRFPARGGSYRPAPVAGQHTLSIRAAVRDLDPVSTVPGHHHPQKVG